MGFQNGLSGLNAAAQNLDVIGHNVANVNTIGAKSSRAMISESGPAAATRPSEITTRLSARRVTSPKEWVT